MTLLVVHLALAAAYAGFQWTVRLLVHPQFALVPAAAFGAYERSHQRLVTRVVGPLFAGQGVTTLHRRLDVGWDPAAHRRLLRVDGLRVAAATAGAAAAAWALLAAWAGDPRGRRRRRLA